MSSTFIIILLFNSDGVHFTIKLKNTQQINQTKKNLNKQNLRKKNVVEKSL